MKVVVELGNRHINIINHALDCSYDKDDDEDLADAIIELIEQVGEMMWNLGGRYCSCRLVRIWEKMWKLGDNK